MTPGGTFQIYRQHLRPRMLFQFNGVFVGFPSFFDSFRVRSTPLNKNPVANWRFIRIHYKQIWKSDPSCRRETLSTNPASTTSKVLHPGDMKRNEKCRIPTCCKLIETLPKNAPTLTTVAGKGKWTDVRSILIGAPGPKLIMLSEPHTTATAAQNGGPQWNIMLVSCLHMVKQRKTRDSKCQVLWFHQK